MDVSIFEIIGPVMIGPSSSHTAGMARIGRMAHQIAGQAPLSIALTLHQAIRYTYQGHRTDAALIGGALGIREDDPALRTALQLASARGIGTSVAFFADTNLNPNTVQLEMTLGDGESCCVRGISVGGGSLVITAVDGIPLTISSSEWHALLWSDRDLSEQLPTSIGANCSRASSSCQHLTLLSFDRQPTEDLLQTLGRLPGVSKCRLLSPVLSYGSVQGSQPLFKTCAELVQRATESNRSIAQLSVDYEVSRSGRSAADIRRQMAEQLQVMQQSCQQGLEQEVKLNFGLTSGRDGKLLAAAAQAGKTLSGSVLPAAIARALATMEVNGSMGRVVASPTAGSSGIIPGCYLTVQASQGLPDEELVDALLTAAILGVMMAQQQASFSGVVGGCQAEVGVSSAIAAGGLVQLGGGDARQIVHGMAMALKNLLGLICDPIAGPVEVPCIKRNAVGVANAFAAADMALAGIESFIPPDEVIAALVNTQRLLPPALKGTTTGGLACTCTAQAIRAQLSGGDPIS